VSVWQTRLFVLLAISGLQLSCIGNCRDVELEPVEGGDFVVARHTYGPDEPHWLIGARVTIDLDTQSAMLRYTREGTTYEVHYVLDENYD
jgi:hypothetical protein